MNMLRNIKFYLSALAILVGATSCLDKYPGSSIPEKEAMRTFADAEQTLTGIYASLKSNALYSGYLTLLPDIQADLVYAVEHHARRAARVAFSDSFRGVCAIFTFLLSLPFGLA